jgi:DNA-binding NtrC family response regulator
MKMKTKKDVSVVVVDSDRIHAEELEALLVTEGYHVSLAKSIDSFLNSDTNAANVEAVLFELEGELSEIKQKVSQMKDKTSKEALIIMMSAFSIDALRLAVCSGCHEFLAKPVGHDELISLLKRKRRGKIPAKISMTIKLEAIIHDN